MFKKIAMIASLMLLPFAGVQANEPWPTKPVKVMVGFAPGGGSDVTARVWAKYVEKLWGQPIVIENRPGGDSNIGLRQMLAGPADGYTLSSVNTNVMAIQLGLAKPGFNWMTDLVTVAYTGDNPPLVIVTNSQSKVTNVRELQRLGETRPLSYGLPGLGTPHHLFGSLLANHFNQNMIPVPYKGTPPMVNDLIAGTIDFVVTPSSPLIEQNVRIGKLNVVGVFSDRPSPVMPNVPIVSQQGIPGPWARSWFAIMAPAGTPAHIVRKIQADSKAVWPQVFAELVERGMISPAYSEYVDTYERHYQDQQRGWVSVAARAKVKSLD